MANPDSSSASGRKTNSLASTAGILGIAAIVVPLVGILISFLAPNLAIISTVCCGLAVLMAIVGLILGIIALTQLKNRPGQKGKGLAVLGIVVGILGVLSICIIPLVVLFGGAALLTILGPVIGNVFTEINSSLTNVP